MPSLAMRNGDFPPSAPRLRPELALRDAVVQSIHRQSVPEQSDANLITSQAKTLLPFLPTPTNLNSAGLQNGSPNYTTASYDKFGMNGVDTG